MAQLLAGFVMPHAPGFAIAPEAPALAQRQRCMDAYATIKSRVQELNVDTVIVIGDDHYTLNGPSCIPACMIGIGEVEGPIENWLGLPRTRVENNSPLAQHIMNFGLKNGVDWAVAKTMLLDHSAYLPYHFALRGIPGIRTIPVYLNSGVDPLISSQRCYQIGQSIGAAIASAPSNERVAIFGTGGISHWVGMAEMGKINPEWDARILAMAESGDVEALIALDDQEIADAAGNGAWEIKNWICAMGALGNCRGETIAYEAVPEWVTGCGYMELQAA